ncbi:hypothetical protein RFI_25712 [Reticulomyxa filosa]|uniref:Kelch motif family protein n=1 Tax=Reticulomyxa filosa TaxID=46433 RepID=X6MCQ4_RETFI|nr:hypothetical protein RFI_25712 [Reticulomyxa filosa]|eukprot:ETO11664.1 hypothetical protein RFI_25712 [Reticulomyxa filosa]
MLLFCEDIGLSIEYDEDNNTFQFQKLPVCHDIKPFYQYAYVCINDVILFFGGLSYKESDEIISKSVHKYSIRENKWMGFQSTLPSPLYDCVAILSEDNTYVHIIGQVWLKTEVSEWSNEKGIELKVEEEDKKEEEDDDEEENEEEEKDSDSERSQQITTHFQNLKKLPTTLIYFSMCATQTRAPHLWRS